MTKKLYSNIEKTKLSGQDISVNGVLRILGLSKSGYYDFTTRSLSKTAKKRDFIMDNILAIYDMSNQIFGATKIYKKLLDKNISVSERTVTNYMKILGIRAIYVKKSKHGTQKPDITCELKNILNQQFNPDDPNEFWCTDITYIPTLDGYVYLSCIMDLFSRKIIAWDLSDTLDAQNVVNALNKAILKRGCRPKVIHTDRGCQFTSILWKDACKDISRSFSKKHYPWDNACIESFHSLIKREWLNRYAIRDIDDAHNLIFEYIDAFYNTIRPHSACDYMSPDEFEEYYSKIKLEKKQESKRLCRESCLQ